MRPASSVGWTGATRCALPARPAVAGPPKRGHHPGAGTPAYPEPAGADVVDPNAESDTDEARGLMNRIVTTGAGGVAAAVVAVLIAFWLLGLLR